MKILCFVQCDDNLMNAVSKESIALSQEIKNKSNGHLDILTFNENVANELTQYDSDSIFLAKDENLNDYNPLYYTSAAEYVLNKGE